jgi:hypothetical protein
MADGHVVYDEAGDFLPWMVREVLAAERQRAYVATLRFCEELYSDTSGRFWDRVFGRAEGVVLRDRDRRLSRREALAEFEGLGPVSGREVRPCPSPSPSPSCPAPRVTSRCSPRTGMRSSTA